MTCFWEDFNEAFASVIPCRALCLSEGGSVRGSSLYTALEMQAYIATEISHDIAFTGKALSTDFYWYVPLDCSAVELGIFSLWVSMIDRCESSIVTWVCKQASCCK